MGRTFPVLGYSPQDRDNDAPEIQGLIVGTAELTLDGEPFPWGTVGDWTVKFGDDRLATLTVTIPISLPADPAVKA